MELSVLIVNYNTRDLLRRCLAAAEEACAGRDAEIIVVDNASGDGSAEMVRAEFPRVRLIASDANPGFGAANDRAAKESRGEFLWLVNPDCCVNADAERKLMDALRAHPEAAAAGCRLMNADGQPEMSCGRLPGPALLLMRLTSTLGLLRFTRAWRDFAMADWDRSDTRPVEFASAACLLVRRADFEAVGGFDERYFLYLEDLDLCRRLRECGREIHHVHDATVEHALHASTATSPRAYAEQLRSNLLYLRAHHPKSPARSFAVLMLLTETAKVLAMTPLRLLALRASKAKLGLRRYRATLRLWPRMWRPQATAAPPSVLFLTEGDDSGSSPASRHRVYGYLPLFRALGWKAEAWPSWPAKYFKALPPTPQLRERSRALWAIRVAGGCCLMLATRLWHAVRSRGWDIVVVQRDLLPFGPPWIEGLLRRLHRRIVFDIDDAIYLLNDAKIARIVAMSDLVLAGNETLAEYCRRHAPKVAIVPTSVPLRPARVHDRTNARTHERTNAPAHERTILGWMGTSGNLKHLETLIPVFEELQRRGKDFSVNISVERMTSDRFAGPLYHIETWTPENEAAFLERIDVGLMPLIDDEWSRAKCGAKLLGYQSAGVPVVASPVGVNANIVRPGENGFLATTTAEWVECLSRLMDDAELRRRIGEAGRETVRTSYSVEAVFERLRAALETIGGTLLEAGSPKPPPRTL